MDILNRLPHRFRFKAGKYIPEDVRVHNKQKVANIFLNSWKRPRIL